MARDYDKIVKLSETIWNVNRYTLLDSIERQTGRPVPRDCLTLIEFCFRNGCVAMEQTIGKDRRANV